MSPFDWLKSITVTKQPWNSFSEEGKDGFNAFIINKALSFNKDYIKIVEIAMLYPLPNEKLYEFYCNMLPKKNIWNKWIKSQNLFNEDELNHIAKYFECSTREAKEIINLLDVEDKKIILLEIKGIEDNFKKTKKSKKKT